MKRVAVTCAVIIVAGELLACQRDTDTDHPFEWEFPGGKIEHGETPEECIIREIKEELGVDVFVERMLEPIEHDYGFKKIRLIPFLCKLIAGKPRAIEHKALKWCSIKCFTDLKWCEADRKLFYLNKSEIR